MCIIVKTCIFMKMNEVASTAWFYSPHNFHFWVSIQNFCCFIKSSFNIFKRYHAYKKKIKFKISNTYCSFSLCININIFRKWNTLKKQVFCFLFEVCLSCMLHFLKILYDETINHKYQRKKHFNFIIPFGIF